MKRSLFLASIITVMAGLSASVAQAALIPFLSPPLTNNLAGTGNFSHVGNAFGIPAATTTKVNRLGFWDKDGDGLTQSHVVAITTYNPGNDTWTVLARAEVPAGTGATLQDGYRWIVIPELTLAPTFGNGYDYAVIFDLGGDEHRQGPGILDDNIAFNATLYSNNAFFTQNGSGGVNSNFPIPAVGGTIVNTPSYISAAGIHYVGGNIGYDPIPEPATAALALLGVALTLPRRTRR